MLRHPDAPRRIAHTAVALMRSLLALAVLAVLLVGLPWGLVRFVGWPLPPAVPGWSDVETVLLSPMSTLFLLRLLACVLWPVWALFAWDIARSVTDLVHGGSWVRRPNIGPVHALATALVAATVVSLLSRPGATVPAPTGQRAIDTVSIRPAVAATMTLPNSTTTLDVAQRRVVPGTVEVRSPEAGVYDSMWRIAQRSLGQGDRWPEIYRLNCGVTQADGRALMNPNLIRPGWVFHLPGNEHAVAPPHRPRPRPSRTTVPKQRSSSAPTAPASRTTEPAPSPSNATPVATASPSPTVPRAEPSAAPRPPGIALASGGYVGIGLAALVSAALVTVRLRRRRKYRPGSGGRDDLTIAPVVRALRIAYDATLNDRSAAPDSSVGDDFQPPVSDPAAPPAERVSPTMVIGERDGGELAWDLASAHGLGLVGPGSLDAARALLTAQLAEHVKSSNVPVDVIIPESDARILLGEDFTGRPSWLRVVGTLNGTLDVLEHELLDRTDPADGTTATGAVRHLLVATPAEWASRRLQPVLENGASLGLAAVLIGQWRAGTTAHVRPDGTVSASTPQRELTGARLFTLPEAETRTLLDLLAEATGPAARRDERGTNEGTYTAPVSPTTAVTQDRPASNEHPPAPSTLPRRQKAVATVRTTSDPHRPDASDASLEDLHRLLGALKTTATAPASESREPPAPGHAMTFTVLGRVRLLHHPDGPEDEVDVTSALAPKHREILTYLALNRAGVRRETLTASIWPDAPRDRPYNSFHATLSQMRKAIRTATEDAVADIAHQDDGTYALDPAQTRVDLWDLEDALRTGRPEEDDAVLQRVLDTYRGDLAPELTAEWLDVPREALRREVLDAVTNRARALRRTAPDRALALLEHARVLDRYNEAVYCDIAEIQVELGQTDAVARTYALLTSALVELDDEPTPESVSLFKSAMRSQRVSRTVQGQQAG